MGQFAISKSEAQRIATVAKLEQGTLEQVVNTETPIADEVIYHIANHRPEEQSTAFKRFADLPVARVRALVHRDQEAASVQQAPAGRPANYHLRLPGGNAMLSAIHTRLTAHQWSENGGAVAFVKELTRLLNDSAFHDRLERDLG